MAASSSEGMQLVAPFIELPCQASPQAELYVHDNFVGIPSGEQDLVFLSAEEACHLIAAGLCTFGLPGASVRRVSRDMKIRLYCER